MVNYGPCPLTSEAFTQLRAEGLSYRAIGKQFNISGNAVAGWASRNGYSTPGASPVKRREKRIEQITPKIKRLPPVARSLPELGPPSRQCQWIAGDPGPDEKCKCLKRVQRGKPYCPKHWEKSFIKRKRTADGVWINLGRAR